MIDDDKIKRQVEILLKLMNGCPHGSARVFWTDATVVKIEKIETEAVIKK